MSDPYADLDIDPAVLADVTRVVQELMKQQQLDLENGGQLYEEQELDEDDSIYYRDNNNHNHNNDPFGISGVSRDVHARDSLEHADRHDFVVSLLSVKDDGHGDKEPKGHSEALEEVSTSPFSSKAPSSQSTSTSSALSLTSSSTTSLTPLKSSSQPFSLQDSALKPDSTHLASPSSNDGSDVDTSLLPGQKTPTRATATVNASATDPDGENHQFFEHASSQDISVSKTPSSSPTKATTPRYETIPRAIPASASPPSRLRRKKALLIGINYFGDPNQLLGCINDTRDVFGFLNGYYGFRYQDTVMLTDDQIYEDKRPTGANIRYWMKWLVKDAEPQDSLFFHYAGKTKSMIGNYDMMEKSYLLEFF